MDIVAVMPRVFVPLVLMLSACTTNPVNTLHQDQAALSFDHSLFGERPDIVDATRLFDLRENQESAFLDFFHDPIMQETPAHERVYVYLRDLTSDFDFHNDTYTATQALDKSAGNCLSLAIITTALANLVNVETGYQLVDSTPVYVQRGSIVSKFMHVRSLLYDPTWQTQDENDGSQKRPGIRFDYFPDDTQRVRLIGNLSSVEYVAMYYSNVAGEAIAAGDIDSAFWFLLESLIINPENTLALNMLAIVYGRAGDDAMAERIYQHGIALLPKDVTLLRNYRVLLKRHGRTEEVKAISKLLSALDDGNPFDWVNAGRNAYSEGEYREAIKLYKQAVEIAPYLHEAYAGMALAYLRLGDRRRGERDLKRALENSQRQTTRSLYQAKLTMLSQ